MEARVLFNKDGSIRVFRVNKDCDSNRRCTNNSEEEKPIRFVNEESAVKVHRLLKYIDAAFTDEEKVLMADGFKTINKDKNYKVMVTLGEVEVKEDTEEDEYTECTEELAGIIGHILRSTGCGF